MQRAVSNVEDASGGVTGCAAMTVNLALGFYPVSVDVPVAWGDMDAYGHVNNAMFLRYFETGRMAYFGRSGIDGRMATERIGPILAQASVSYLRPVIFPDTLTVATTVVRLGNTSVIMASRCWSRAQGEIAAKGESVIVMMNYVTGSKITVDDALRARIVALEASAQDGS